MLFDEPLTKKKAAGLRMPPLPPACLNWRPPAQFPNLSNAVALSFDVETKEEDWQGGPGWARGKSSLCGFSIGAVDRQGSMASWYFPIAHTVEPEYNLNPTHCLQWLKAQLATPHITKVAANIIFDMGTLADVGINVQGPLQDVQFAEALIDENGIVELDYIGRKYAGEGKSQLEMVNWLRQAYSTPPKENIYRCSPRLAGPYGEGDALLPLQILPKQQVILDNEQLNYVYRMECESVPIYVKMRQEGVTVNVAQAEKVYHELEGVIADQYKKLSYECGYTITTTAASQLGKLFDHIGLKYPKTSEGKPSFRKEWLRDLQHPVGISVNEIRNYEKCRGTFLKKYILERNINGKLHCQYHPLHSEEGGTITGRLSSSDPNLQNIPVRTEIGKEIRKCFTHDPGHIRIRKIDYSQIEYRGLAHYAVGPGANELRERYRKDPKTDYHQGVMNAVAQVRGFDLSTYTKQQISDFRRPIKNVNFGLIYGQSQALLAYTSGMTPEQAAIFFPAYHQAAPYVKPTMKATAEELQRNGFITTIYGRRTRFNLWESAEYGKRTAGLPYKEALYVYGSNIKRAYDYRGINYRLQGTAAEILKDAMRKCHIDGVFNEIGYPRLQVHDELVFSQFEENPRAWEHFTYIMENTTRLNVPIKIEISDGPNWGSLE